MATCISNQAVEITRKDNPGYRAIDAMNETIANIVYEYQRIVESDDAWPSAQYVQDKLKGESFKASEEQQELYDSLGLSETKTFTSEAQRDAFIEKYLKNNGTWVFPESSITMYRGIKGDYKLSVGEPLAKNKKATISLNTNSLNITGNEFKNSLFRGQGYEPDIDKDGNLHLHTAYDALSRLRTLSFDRTREGAEQYGHRSAEHPFIIEIDEDFVDTLLPKGEYSREKVENGDRFRYNEEFNEVRLSFDGEIVIPKGKFNIYQTNETLEINNIEQIEGVVYDLQRMEERMEIEENNGASEIFGRLHYNDFKSVYNALDSFLGKYKGYPIIQALYDANVFKYYQHSAGSPVMPSRNYRDLIDAGLLTYREQKMVDSQPNGEPIEYTEAYVDISDELRQHIQHILNIKGNDTNQVKSNDKLSNLLTEQEYIDINDELELSEDKTSTFLDNFLNKVLLVNPRYKVDESADDFAYKYLFRNQPKTDNYNLGKKIFGYDVRLSLMEPRTRLEKQLNIFLQEWESKLIDIINNPPMLNARQDLYNQRRDILTQISELQKLLDSHADVDRRATGYKIKKLKSQLEDVENSIRIANYKNHAMLLAAKNRLIALKTIPNLKELVRNRILAEYESRVPSREVSEKLESKRNLFEAIRKAQKSTSRSQSSTALFDEKETREITVDELHNTILNQYPEYKELLQLYKAANPKLKIIVGGDPEITQTGHIEAGYYRISTNTIHLTNVADIYTTIHELGHSATTFGLSFEEREGGKEGKVTTKALDDQVKKFMDYIRNYIKSEQLNPELFAPSSTKLFGQVIESPASVYAFTSPYEFITEVLANTSLQNLLSNIPAMDKKHFKSLLHQIWDTIVNFLTKTFGKNVDKNALDQAKKLAYAAMFLQQQHIDEAYEWLNEKDTDEKQSMLLEPDGSVDIHFTKGHNPELSNFAPRRTTIDLSNFRTLDGTKQITFPSVEHAFQYMKFIAVQQMYSRQVKDGNKTKVVWTNRSRAEELQKAAQNVLTATSGVSAKSKGLALRLTEQEQKAWDSYSPQLMKFLLQQSFAQNKGARDLLLATGDAKLTHSVAESKKGPNWKELFPQLLTEIRESYRTNELKPELNESSPRITESTGSYRQRTIENVSWSDVTMAFAVDSETAGEKLTRNESIKQKKFYDEGFPRGAEQLDINDIPRKVKNFINDAVGINADQSYGHRGKKLPIKDIKLNIAGNGIYTLAKYGISQEQINNYITEYIKELINQGVTISEIRSGGQTGVDEAGIIAAQRLGIPCSIHAPKNFIMRGTDGKDVSNKEAFISRFNAKQPQATKPNQPVAPEAPSIVEQIVNLLKDQGIKVYGKTNLVNFLKNKGDKNIQKYLSNKARARAEQLLKKMRPDMEEYEIKSTLKWLHELQNDPETNVYVNAVVNWVANKSIRFPRDHEIARQVFDEARKRRIDVFKYRTLTDLLKSKEMQPKSEKPKFDPDKAPTFSNKTQVITQSGRELTVYDVEDNEAGQRDVCKAVSAHYAVSPWCLATFTSTGEPTTSAKGFWSNYNSIDRKIAFENGRPVAFSSNSFVGRRNVLEHGTLRGYNVAIDPEVGGYPHIVQPVDGEYTIEQMQPLIDEGLVRVLSDPYRLRNHWFEVTERGLREANMITTTMPKESWWDLDDNAPQPQLGDWVRSTVPERLIPETKESKMLKEAAVSERLSKMIADRNFFDENGWFQVGYLQSYLANKLKSAIENNDSRVSKLRKFWDEDLNDFVNDEMETAVTDEINAIISAQFLGINFFDEHEKVNREVNKLLNDRIYDLSEESILNRYAEEADKSLNNFNVVSPIIRKNLKFLDKYLNERNEFTDKIASAAYGAIKEKIEYYDDPSLPFPNQNKNENALSTEELEKVFNEYYELAEKEDLGNKTNFEIYRFTNLFWLNRGTDTSERFNEPLTFNDLIGDYDDVPGGVPTTAEQIGVDFVEAMDELRDSNPSADEVLAELNREIHWFNQSIDEADYAELTEVPEYIREAAPQIGGIQSAIEGFHYMLGRYVDPQSVTTQEFINYFNDYLTEINQIGFDANNDFPFYQTEEGEIYGFVDEDNSMYLDETVITPEHPIHEFTHIWDRIVQEKQPELWKQGIELMRQIDLWDDVLNSEQYGKKWADLSEEERTNRIASEVHSRLTGKEGERILNEIAEKEGKANIISKLKRWLKEVWMSLRETFGSAWTEQELAALTLKDFTQLTIRDLTEGTLKDFLTKQEKKSVISEETDIPIGVKELTELKQDKEYQKDALLLNQFEKLTKEYNIPMSTIDEAAVDIANWISDQISDIMEDPSIAKQLGVDISEDEIKTMSRIDVIKKLTPNALFEWCKNDRFLHNEDIDIDDIELAQQLQNMAECWDFLMQRSLMTILENEKVAITIGDNTSAMTVTEITDDIDIDNPADIAEQEAAEETGENQQQWGIENMTVDLLGTATAAVRDELRRCYVLDEDGDRVLTDRGVFKRIPMREALNSLQRWVEGSQKLSDAVAKLETKVDKNPWLADLISKLKNPNYEKLQSEMWQVLNAPFINYWVVVKKDGKFITTNVNSRPALKEAVNNIQAIYSAGIHPLFTLDGVNAEHLKTLKEESELLSKNIRTKVEALQKEGKDISEDEELFKQAVGSIGIALNILGYSAPAELVAENLTNEAILNTASVLSSIVWTIDKNKNNKSYNPFAYLDVEGKQNKGSIKGYLNQLLSPLTESLEDTAITCFYDNGKMYQSRVKPSFLTLQMQNFHLQGEEFKEFIRQNYAELPWFRDQDESFEVDWTKGWRNPLLERLITNQDARDHFRHKVQLNFNKKQYMKGMNPSQYIMSSITEFVAGMENSDKGLTYSYIRIPIQSNKPSSEYIMMEVFTGSTYQDDITYRLKMIFDQEMSRISTVRKRNYERGKDDGYIDGFDSVGRKFCFLDFMNYFLDTNEGKNSELGKLLERKLSGEKEKQLSPDEESTFLDLVTKEIKARMDAKIEGILAEWDKEGITKAAESISKIGPVDQIRETLKKFLWNDSLGAMNIMELFVGDIAFYEDADTLQKRLAELHAPGIRPNTEVKYQGKNITDGKFRAVQLADFELDAKEFKTNILENVKTVFERKIAEAPENEKQAWRDLLDHLTNEETGLFVTDINVTDGQAFNCPTSYMKKARMYGKWSDAQEAVLQKIRKGEKYTWADVKNAFSTPTFATTKPTVYGNAVVDTGVRESGALDKISVPTYFKNSEYTIMLADAILQGEDTGRPNMLRAIFNVMEQSHWKKGPNGEDVYQNDGIDTIQFVSAVKSGVGKTVDLVQFLNNPNGEKLAEEYLKQQIYLDPTNNKMPNGKNYNLHTVRELPFESYAIQMDVSNHFLEHEQIHGSQNRMIIPSELAETDAEGNTVYYDTPQGKKTAKEFGKIYEETIGANIQQSIKELQEMLGLPIDGSNESQLSGQSTLKKNLAISKILKREIMSNPRYGLDLYFACSIDPETGGFRIPLGDPVQSKRIEQLLNSVIKNKINKQKIAGGPVVQVTNFGTSKNLNIRFKNKNKPGELLMTRNEFFEKNNTTSDKAYKDYIDKNQGGIAHFEVYASASTKKLFEHFADKDGNIDIGAIEMVNPDLLKMIGYRIPTEAKYSITPMKIVGFLPREAGEAIMMPYEITLLNGSDFDVDKMYLMSKVFDIEKAGEFYDFELTEPNWKAEKRLANQIDKFMSGILDTSLENSNGEVTVETINRFMSRHKDWEGYQEALKKYGEIKKARRKAWNQVVLDMMNAAKSKYELSEAQKKLINQTVDSRKELTAEQKEADKKDLISKITDKTLRDKAVSFLKGGYRENSHYDDAVTREFRKVFLKALYRTKDPADMKKVRDNQIIDMSWSVLTHETTAHELLNPGGFDPQKKMGYVMSILKDPANEGKYDYHDLMKNYSLGELRKLASSNTSLMFFDGQAKYYRQNSAAGSLTGIFAVHRTAHAVLERDNLHIHLAGLLGSKRNPFKSFNIAGVDFTDYMKIDTRFDRLGNSVGKILGSLVAAAVDAGKYPVLNLSNINNETANVCVSMIKLGMTFEDTALFLSQKVIDDLLAKHSAENIDGYKSLQSLINEELAELEKSSKIDRTSPLWTDDLTQEDLIDGLLDTNIEHTYRVLSALKKMLKIADAMRLPTAATRYNSISSAVGPQIINNIIAEKKIQKMNSKSFIYTEEGKYNNDPALSVEDIINLHPILQQFYRANSIAKQVFKGMPTSSNGFDSVIDSVVAMGLDDNMFNDAKLMSGLSDFYQTYLLYKTGVVKHSELYHYINEFPTEFITKKMKDKHPDNKLVQAITYNKDKAGRIILEIPTTGMDQSAKSPLMSAWWDLYNVDKKLAIDLFKYCIYRGGVGFSPKTFMNLVPVFLKEVIPGYTDTYNKLPQLDTGEPGRETSEPQKILDMFVQNNYNNGKLITNMTKEFNRDKNLYLTQEKGFSGTIEYSPSDYEKFTDVPYFRLNDKIYKQVYNDKMYHVLKYIELPILGNDKNYVEILVSNEKPAVSTVDTTSDFDNFDTREDSDIIDPSNTFDTADAITTDRTEDTRTILEKQRDTPTAIDLFADAMGDPNLGASRYTAWKQAPKSVKDVNREKLDNFFTERLRIRGIQANKKLLDELFKQLC